MLRLAAPLKEPDVAFDQLAVVGELRLSDCIWRTPSCPRKTPRDDRTTTSSAWFSSRFGGEGQGDLDAGGAEVDEGDEGVG